MATKSLEPQTIAVRDVFQSTQSPVKLLFESLPLACGFEPFKENERQQNSNAFLNELVKHLNYLNAAYSNLLEGFQKQLTQALKESPEYSLKDLRTNIAKKYAGLDKYTTDLQGLKAFILRLQNNKETDIAWLESIAAFLGKAPPTKWLQNNLLDAEFRLIELCDRLEQLALVHSHQLQADEKTQVTVFRVVNEHGSKDQVAYLNQRQRTNPEKYRKIP